MQRQKHDESRKKKQTKPTRNYVLQNAAKRVHPDIKRKNDNNLPKTYLHGYTCTCFFSEEISKGRLVLSIMVSCSRGVQAITYSQLFHCLPPAPRRHELCANERSEANSLLESAAAAAVAFKSTDGYSLTFYMVYTSPVPCESM